MQTKRAVRLVWYAYLRLQTQWSWQLSIMLERVGENKLVNKLCLVSLKWSACCLCTLQGALHYMEDSAGYLPCHHQQAVAGQFWYIVLALQIVSSSKKIPYVASSLSHVERQSYVKSMDKKTYLLGTKSKPDNIVRDAKLRYWFQP